MSRFPYLPLWTDAYLADTLHLSTLESGAYLHLLMVAWRTPDCALPDDPVLLARWCKLDRRTWDRISSRVMAFWTFQDGKWRQKRLSKEWDLCNKHAEAKRASGRAGGLARSLKNNKAGLAELEIRSSETVASIPIPIPKKEREDPVAYATAGEPANEDPKARLFRIGKTLLVSFGIAEKRTGALLGQWLKICADPVGILAAIQYARDQNVAEPIAYVSTVLSAEKGASNGSGRRYGKPSWLDLGSKLAAEIREKELAAGIGRPHDPLGGD